MLKSPSLQWFLSYLARLRGWTCKLLMWGQSIVLSDNHGEILLDSRTINNVKMILNNVTEIMHNNCWWSVKYVTTLVIYFTVMTINCSQPGILAKMLWNRLKHLVLFGRRPVINHSNQWIWNEQWTPFVPRLQINGQTGNNCWKL